MHGIEKILCAFSLCLLVAAAYGCTREEAQSGQAAPARGHLSGQVRDAAGDPLQGVMVTAYDRQGHRGITVFSDEQGHYRFPALEPLTYRLRTRLIGFEAPEERDVDLSGSGAEVDLVLAATEDFHRQLPGSYYTAALAREWPDAVARDDFTLACANCHQIGNHNWQGHKTAESWQQVIDRMNALGGTRLRAHTKPDVIPALVKIFGKELPAGTFSRPAPPSGDTLRAVIREYELAPGQTSNCHDPEIGPNGIIYSEDGYWVDPETLERGYIAVEEGNPHSLKQGPDGRIWITITEADMLAVLDPETREVHYYEQPVIDGERGIYPHTLKFDGQGRIWYTLTVSNHVARFDPESEAFVYHRLPPGQGREGDLPVPNGIPVAYGLDIAPDGGIWWSQLYGGRIGRVDPESGELRAWATPVAGPRRLGAGPDGRIWVPFYGPSRLGVFDPDIEEWELYRLPGPEYGELPYALNVNPDTGHVWVTGSNSDSLLRFDPEREAFTVYPLPTPNAFTRDIVFDDNGDVWTCTAGTLIDGEREQEPGPGRVVKIELEGAP